MTNLAPDTKSSNFTNDSKYDVFINFRGEDTRKNFTSHLDKALTEKKIRAYIDEKTLRKGEEISSGLLKAIQESKISLIIFSQTYPRSKWCLEELVYILKCREEQGQIVMPIFYGVDPSHVRNPDKGIYADAFVEYKRSSKYTEEKLCEWKVALGKAGNITGWDSRDRYEPNLIENIVESVLSTLNDHFTWHATEDVKNPVGTEKHLLDFESALQIGSSDVRILGLSGMGGIGKSTLARSVFHKLSSHFEGCCFLENVREESKRRGLDYLESKLFSELLGKEDMEDVANHKDRVREKKVLIVLDDVNDLEQLEHLAGDRSWFGSGSRIIITTRIAYFLRFYADKIYEAHLLTSNEALQVFLRNAFGVGSSFDECYVELSKLMVHYANRHPLLLKLLGSSLRAGTLKKWESTLDKLKTATEYDFHAVLKVCFEGLDDAEKDILLHIAFLKGKDMDLIERKLEESGNLCVRKGLKALMEKSLISIKGDGQVWMHDWVQDMAWKIVCQESTKGARHNSWSLITQAIYHVWRTNKETGAVEKKYFDVSKIDYEELLRALKMLRKRYHASEYLPSTINQHNLFGLDMSSGQLTQFWNEIQEASLSVGFLISYDGQWKRTRGRWSFIGLKSKGMTVSKDMTYDELVKRLYNSLKIDQSEYDLDMRFLVNSAVPMAPLVIQNDEDVKFFIGWGSQTQKPWLVKPKPEATPCSPLATSLPPLSPTYPTPSPSSTPGTSSSPTDPPPTPPSRDHRLVMTTQISYRPRKLQKGLDY